MRPLRIRAEGFGPFREPVDVDLADVDFFALIGPTGAGKSAVIDAMCFALYGSVPRYGDNRAVAPAISAGALEATVTLDFRAGGHDHVVTRAVRRTKQGASTRDARLDRVHADGTVEALSSSARDLTNVVTELVGLPFEHFTKCVVLPQGDFAEFLHATPADRQDLLVRLLDVGRYERVGARARQVADAARAAVEAREQRLAALAGATEEAVAAADARHAAVLALRDEIARRRPDDERLAREVHEHERAAASARDLVAALGGIEVPPDLRRAHDELTAARVAERAAAEGLVRAEAASTAARAAVEALPEPAHLEAAMAARDDLAAVTASLGGARDELAGAESTATRCASGEADAQRDAEAADAAYESARHVHLPHELAATLVVGEPCPVCEQPVRALPRRDASDALDEARRRRDAAQQRLAASRAERAAADRAASGLAARVHELEQQHATLTARAAELDGVDVEARLAAARAAKEALDAAAGDEREAREREKTARGARESLERALERGAARFGAQRDPLVGGGLVPPDRTGDLVADWDALAGWAAEELPRQQKLAGDATTAARRAQEDRRAAVAAVQERARALGIAGRDLAALAESAAATAEGAARDVADLRRDREEADSLRASIEVTRTEQAVAEELRRHLTARGFERWLVAEALHALVAGATTTLRELSSDAYSLVLDEPTADLVVVDHVNADERRSVRTLSGGETFQASLALALALSERLADLATDGAARLESIFLDEGFGSLDVDALETVAATIERLGTSGRMVGIVTHVRELAERVPVRFEVRKAGATSTVTRVDL
jgi:exonuclease SbcC